MKIERLHLDITDIDSSDDFKSLVELFQSLDQWHKARSLNNEPVRDAKTDAFEPKENRQQETTGVSKNI